MLEKYNEHYTGLLGVTVDLKSSTAYNYFPYVISHVQKTAETSLISSVHSPGMTAGTVRFCWKVCNCHVMLITNIPFEGEGRWLWALNPGEETKRRVTMGPFRLKQVKQTLRAYPQPQNTETSSGLVSKVHSWIKEVPRYSPRSCWLALKNGLLSKSVHDSH